MASAAALAFRELTASSEDRAILRRFYDEIYVREFSDPDEKESLLNIERYLELKATGWYQKNNYQVVVAVAEGEIVGGAIADYLADPNVGVIEFLVTSPRWRGFGFGRRLLDYTEAWVAASAERAAQPRPDWVLAEINDPFRVDLTAENLDPILRAQIWGHWGYRKLDFPYVQPALSKGQLPVHHMMLAVKPLTGDCSDTFSGIRLIAALHAYLRWAMRIPDPTDNAEFRAMGEYLSGRERIAMIPLERYIGYDPSVPITVEAVTEEGSTLDEVVAVYRDAFPPGPSSLDPSALRTAVRDRVPRLESGCYHLWAIRMDGDASVAGMASFFSLSGIGFGGYLALTTPHRGRGLLRSVVARIEAQMRRDRTGATGWLIECESNSHALRVFSNVGFWEVALDYRQPPLPGSAVVSAPTPLSLAYKEFGASYGPPALTRRALRVALESVLGVVYRIDEPHRSEALLIAEAGMAGWRSEAVEWRRRVTEQ